MKKKLPKMLVLPLFLGAVTVAAAGLITGVHLLTEERINRNIFAKQNEGYYKILGLEADAAVKMFDQEVNETLGDGGVISKIDFRINNVSVGVVYDAEIRGYAAGLQFQVGFKDGNYAGFNVVASNETPTYGGIVLEQLNDLLKGKPASTTDLIPASTSAGKTITANALVKVLKLCADDYLDVEEVPQIDPNLFVLGLDAEAVVTSEELEVSATLEQAGVTLKQEIFIDEESQGVIYDVVIKAYRDGLHFKVGFHGDKYTGFYVVAHDETPGLGETLLEEVHGLIKGVDANTDVATLITGGVVANTTVTRNALNAALNECAADYLAGGNE